jgi:hypothetical protein
MTCELTTSLSAMCGIFVGAILNYLAMRKVKSYEWSLLLARDKSDSRQKLYAEFLVEVEALRKCLITKAADVCDDMLPLNTKFASISLVAPAFVVKAADKLAKCVCQIDKVQSAEELKNFNSLKEQFISVARKDVEDVLANV